VAAATCLSIGQNCTAWQLLRNPTLEHELLKFVDERRGSQAGRPSREGDSFNPENRSHRAIPRYWQELREDLTMPAHPNSPVQNLEFPNFHEGDTQSPF
jgi:hypothetical protein